MPKDEILKAMREGMAGSSEHTISQFISITERFWKYSRGDLSRSSVVKYIQHLEREGYAASTRKQQFVVIKRIFDFAKVEWPFGKRVPADVPTAVPDWEVVKVVFTLDEVAAMVAAARNNPQWAALLCVSTVYGLRRVEIMNIQPEDIDLKRGLLRIMTRHGGQLREHAIHPHLVPHLEAYPCGLYSDNMLSSIFHQIEVAAGMEKKEGSGWHGIRRTLLGELVNAGLPLPLIYSFMRWKLSVQFGMLGTYYNVSPAEVDEKVFEAHPFLEMWK